VPLIGIPLHDAQSLKLFAAVHWETKTSWTSSPHTRSVRVIHGACQRHKSLCLPSKYRILDLLVCILNKYAGGPHALLAALVVH
jgi:hypothetical protein